MVKSSTRGQKNTVFPCAAGKGASVYGKPVITIAETRNQRGVYLCEVGTDTAKEILYARMKAEPTPADEATSYAIRFLMIRRFFRRQRRSNWSRKSLWRSGKRKMRLLWDNKSGVTKRWTAWCMPTRHYVCPCNAGSLIWLYWQNPGKKRRPGQPLKNWQRSCPEE